MTQPSDPAKKGNGRLRQVTENTPEWRQALTLSDKGTPKPTLGNLELFLRHLPAFRGRLFWNEMSAEVELDGGRVEDVEISQMRVTLERTEGVAFPTEAAFQAVALVAREQSYHPIRDYLAGLRWDGEVRIPRVVPEILHAEHVPLHEAYVRKFLIGAVARALHPGCKLDTVLIFSGPQGAGKSTFFRILAGDWFSDTEMDLGSKDAYLVLGASWIYEWGELATLHKSSQERAKAFLSASEDTFRQPYAHTVSRRARTSVIVGTTNEDAFLRDASGSRRFWVMAVPPDIDTDRLKEWRDQLWAEAKVLFEQGDPWWLDQAEDRERAERAGAFGVEDPWTETIAEYAQGRDGFTAAQVLDKLGVEQARQTTKELMRVAEVLKKIGFEKRREMIRGERVVRWYRPPTLPGMVA